MRIVADTNLLIASIFWDGPPYKIVQRALDGLVQIVASQMILNEVRKVLTDPREKFQLSEQEIDDIIQGILLYVTVVEPKTFLSVVRDPKDDPIIACAIDARAEFIVTRDNDLLDLKEYCGIKIITPEEFLQIT